jgi:hypothetical protein
MRTNAHQKVNAGHLKRNVFENSESTFRQYDLRQHALALGWPPEQIVVIDNDLGQSGASAVGREGFQRLVTEVSMGHAGIVLGLEVSRLARNSTDWHRLLEICALTDTLILHEDGIYDPAHYNDRQRGLLFPRRLRKGPQKGDLVWAELTHSRALQVLHNPRYAGAFVYGRTRVRKKADGSEECLKRPRDQWILVPGMHPGYLSWEQFEENQRRLRENAQAQGDDRRKSPPREGPALLQGLVLCGVCGRRMTVRYHFRSTKPMPDYVCQKEGIEHGGPICQSITGTPVDKAISELLLQSMTPMALDIALAVQQEIQSRLDEVGRLRRKQVERARYEADQAQRRYMLVDPANRLVADTLEAEWNSKLRALNEAQQEYERLRHTDSLAMDEAQRARIAALASDFPRLWQDPKTPDREKKRMVRLLLEDVTLLKHEQILVHVRFKGGVLKSLLCCLLSARRT